MKFYRYSKSSGEILARCIRNTSDPEQLMPPQQEGIGLIPVEEFGNHYIDVAKLPHVVVEQIPLPASWDRMVISADSGEVATLSIIPEGCVFSINDQLVTVTDGTLEVEADLVGTYTVQIRTPQYIRQRWKIEAI